MLKSSLRKVISSLDEPFPMLESLQLCYSSDKSQRTIVAPSPPSVFEAQNFRHLQLSDF